MSKIGWIGLVVTLAYVAIVYFFARSQLHQVTSLPLNELGDFLAGIVGPVALLWLVLGFFQQGLELRNSVETLKLQATELANSVEQQRNLVEVTRDQLKHDSELLRLQMDRENASKLPVLIVSHHGGTSSSNGVTKKVRIKNQGAPIKLLKYSVSSSSMEVSPSQIPDLVTGGITELRIKFEPSQIREKTVELVIEAQLMDDAPHVERYSFTPSARDLKIVRIYS